jgi:hypothetical protein
MRKKHKVILGVGVLVALAAVYLSIFALVSTSHPAAKSSIARSKEVLAAVGNVNAVGLIGVRQKLVPGGVSCTSSTYVVFGEAGFEFVTVQMSMRTGERDWVVNDLSLGWFSKSVGSC